MRRSAGVYCRISQDREAEGLGVARQEADCRKLAVDRGWKVVDLYVDNDLSGSKRIHRPEYERLLADIEARRIDAVVVWDLDRLTRQPRQLEAFVDACGAAGMRDLATVSGDVNMGDGDGLMVARIKGAVAAAEVDRLAQRVNRKLLELAEAGKPHGGRRPYGFAEDRITHDPTETARVREAAQTVLDGGTLTAAAAPTGLHPSVLKRILCSPRVAGLRQHRGEVIGPAVWEPILERADWERVRRLLQRPVRYSVPYRQHLLSGFAVCGECGAKLSAQSKYNPARVVYQCRSARGGCGKVHVDAARLEEHVVATVGGWLTSKPIRRAVQRHLNGESSDRKLVDEIAAHERQLTDLAAQVGELSITVSEWSAMRQPILDRIEAARRELSRRSHPVVVDVSVIAGRWTHLDVEERRKVFAMFGVRVPVAAVGRGARRFQPERVQVIPSWG